MREVIQVSAHNLLYFEMEYRDEIRKGRQCAVPGCSHRGEHRHHIVFRSKGGGNEPGNLVWLCMAHHLEGVHKGKIGIAGSAPDAVYFQVGNRVWRGDEILEWRCGGGGLVS